MRHPARRRGYAQWCAAASLVALIFICLLWESVLAPLRPGGSTLMFKALPLLLPLFGLLKGRVMAFKWTLLLALPYFTEGVVRGWSDRGMSAWLAIVEALLAAALFASTVVYVRSFPAVPRR